MAMRKAEMFPDNTFASKILVYITRFLQSPLLYSLRALGKDDKGRMRLEGF